MKSPSVVFVGRELLQYRVPFHQQLRGRLQELGVSYEAAFGQVSPSLADRGDSATLGWESRMRNLYVGVAGKELVWQPAFRKIWEADLAIVTQENRLLLNYLVQSLGPLRPSRLAFFGHGRNYQATNRDSASERWKRCWSTRCDWWFVYTDEGRQTIQEMGFPSERITVFHNAVDTTQLRRWDSEISEEELDDKRRALGLKSRNVGIFVGAMQEQKRLPFLVEAARAVRAKIPDFELIIVGSGPFRHVIEEFAQDNSWVHSLGPRFGREKAEIIKLSKVLMMPGLVGLPILDCAALGVPMVTTDYPFHSPEIAYLQHGINGIMTQPWSDVDAFSDVVIHVLTDNTLHNRLSAGARQMASEHTIERMVDCFASGVVAALKSERMRR